MKKLTLLCCFFVAVSSNQKVIAQSSVNSYQSISADENQAKNYISGISFTPEGILRYTESGGTKSVKPADAPLVVKSLLTETKASAIEKLNGLQIKYAMMINVDLESLKNLSLLTFIEDWIGTRYKYGGVTKRGIDCSALTGGLLLAVYGFGAPRTARQQYDASEKIKREELKEGDLVFFNTTGGVSHVGLYLDNDYFVHASSSQGVTITSLNDPYFAKRFIGAGRIVDMPTYAHSISE
ncbi:MAG: NlpC/P60 family protein [Ginsengibacter sp.]